MYLGERLTCTIIVIIKVRDSLTWYLQLPQLHLNMTGGSLASSLVCLQYKASVEELYQQNSKIDGTEGERCPHIRPLATN